MNLRIVHERLSPDRRMASMPVDAGDTVECKDCSCMNDPSAKFCDQCGAKMDAGCALMCASCCCMNDAQAKCCDQCGATLDASRQPGFMAGGMGMMSMAGKRLAEWPAAFGGAIKKVGDQYGGMMVSFTDSDKRDLTGEWFDKNTDFMLGVYPIKGIRALYDHGLDASVGPIPIGDIVDVKVQPEGIFAAFNMGFAKNLKLYLTDLEAPDDWKTQQMAKATRYQSMLKEMLDAGELGWSSGAHPQSVRVAKSGHIERWPIWEASATVKPAMPFETSIHKVKCAPHNFFEFERAEQRPQNHAGVAA